MKKKTRGNGQGTVYKDGATWRAEVRVMTPTGMKRIRKRGFRTKTEALASIPTLKEQLTAPQVNRISFTELWDRWTETPTFLKLSQEKVTSYRIAYNKCKPLQALSDVRNATFDMLQGIIKGLTYYPARDIKRILNGMFELAMKMDCLEKNYAPMLELPSVPKPDKVIFTDEQVAQIEACGDPFRDYILLMVYMGLRPVELRGLCVEDVHFEEHYTDGGRKTAKDVPIAIFPEAEPILRKLCLKQGTGKLCRMSEDDFYDRFYECLAKAGINNSDHKLTPYSCRHTFVTRLTKAGMPQALIQKAARHTSYRTTQGYTHLDVSDVLDRWGQ